MGNSQSTDAVDNTENLGSTLRLVAPGAVSVVDTVIALSTREKFGPLSSIRDRLKPGDILEFNRGMYSHYALYIGNGKVMNVNAEDKNDTSALISEKSLEEVCKSSEVRIRNHDDVAWKYLGRKPKSVDLILSEANRYSGRRLPYEFTFRNCEYYSTYWRFGKGFSTQVAQHSEVPIPTFPSFPLGGMGIAGAVQDAAESIVMAKYANFSEPATI